MAGEKQVSEGAARTVPGPVGGLCKLTVGVAGQAFDLTEWVGRYVRIHPFGGSIWYVFAATNALAGLDLGAEATDAASLDATIPDGTPDEMPEQFVIPSFGTGKSTFLIVKSQAGSVAVRIRAA